MAQYAPHYSLFKINDKIGLVLRVVFWLILSLSIVTGLFPEQLNSYGLNDGVNIINIVCIGLFFILEIVSEFIIMPQADSTRRDDFIDNSFDSRFSASSSQGYYDNDEVAKGLYKAAVNLFENCFFTYSLVKITFLRKILVPGITLLTIVIMAYYGFDRVPVTLTILQAFFSANIAGVLIKQLILIHRLGAIYDNWIALFQHTDLKSNTMHYASSVYRLWLQYEVLHSKIPSGVSTKMFEKHNTRLTTEWAGNMKPRYNIS
jgi:hypothetical protein